MVRKSPLILAGVAVVLVTVFAFAQQQQPTRTEQPGMQAQPMHGQMSHMGQGGQWAKSTDLVGKEVKDGQNNKIGDLKTLVIDMNNGHVLFAILPGSYVDKRDQDIAIPFTALKLSTDAKYLTLNATKDQLAGAPAFNEKNWPNMTDPNFIRQVYAHFNVPNPMMEPARQAGAIEREQEREQEHERNPNP